ncbi:23S ribosomal RNA methyltransferase Erm [Paenibacillus hamazuiensis]|uniref:23S ribosomal RNA methyltransferase Erm n=1 Tax=Paenibacillus hamazuiensis TaxID=2936508 RepID=UPI00200E2C7D
MSKINHTYRGASCSPGNFSAQHLLINGRVVRDMIQLAGITPHETVLDIGAGTGTISIPLAEKAARVLAIENDPAFVRKLIDKTGGIPNIRVQECDFLQSKLPKQPFSVVANIPFSITTPILEKLLGKPDAPLRRAVLIVEKGAARRFTEAPSANPRLLSWRMLYEFRVVRTVERSAFSPPPAVDTAILTISRREQPLIPAHLLAKFAALAAYALRSPHQPLFTALAGVFTPPQIAKLAKALRVDRQSRVCTLRDGQWADVFAAMLRHAPPVRHPKLRRQGCRPCRK